jgi:hypothetical protein
MISCYIQFYGFLKLRRQNKQVLQIKVEKSVVDFKIAADFLYLENRSGH